MNARRFVVPVILSVLFVSIATGWVAVAVAVLLGVVALKFRGKGTQVAVVTTPAVVEVRTAKPVTPGRAAKMSLNQLGTHLFEIEKVTKGGATKYFVTAKNGGSRLFQLMLDESGEGFYLTPCDPDRGWEDMPIRL